PVAGHVGGAADAVGAVGEAVPGGQQAAHHGPHLEVAAVPVEEAPQGGLERPAVRADRVGDVVEVDLLGGAEGEGLELGRAGARLRGGVGGAAHARLEVAHHDVVVGGVVHGFPPAPVARRHEGHYKKVSDL